MARRVYSAADITVVSCEEAVRRRPGMYFGADPGSPDLPTSILRRVIGDAHHDTGGRHRRVDVEITADLSFTVADDQAPDLDDLGEPKPGLYGSLIGQGRWLLVAAAALSTRALIEVRAGGRGWRQELAGAGTAPPQAFAAAGQAGGTRVEFDLDPAFLAAGAVISASLECLRAPVPGCEACASARQDETLSIRDHRP